jgi:DNA-binding transcriptional LysR family regulator
MDWLPEAMHILEDELPNIDVTVSSDYSPWLADDLARSKLDLAFLRPEPQMPALDYKVVMTEPLVVVLPSDHRLASWIAIAIEDIANDTFLGMSKTAPSLQVIIEDYLSAPASISARSTRSTISAWRCRSSPRRAASRSCLPATVIPLRTYAEGNGDPMWKG